MDVNKVILIGRLGKDPEVKTVGGVNLATFSLATSFGTGEKVKTQWHQINLWDKLADVAQKILHKGDKVYIEGRIEYNKVGDGDTARYFTQIVGMNLVNLTGKPTGETSSKPASTSNTPAATASDEDLPF